MADLRFYFDPVCPFAWMTSRWVRQVQAAREYEVDWRFISLRLLNAHIDYDAHFPAGYEAGHTAGLRLLRLAAQVRADHGRPAVGALYAALGEEVFDRDPEPHDPGPHDDGPHDDGAHQGTAEFVAPVLERLGLPADLTAALDAAAWDELLQAETDEALALTGRDVGTPILHVEPPEGVAFFGPVISRLPSDEDALRLWDHVVGLARFPGFAELKRSLREPPQLRALGRTGDGVGPEEDWHAGSRRLKR